MMSEETSPPISRILVVHGGELAQDVALQLVSVGRARHPTMNIKVQCASERPTKWFKDCGTDTVVCFILQTIENAAPTEEGGTTVRFFQRQTHPPDLVKFRFAVLGLGDSNLLLDRQTTTAKDCNQVAQALDARLAGLGGVRHVALRMADERTGLSEVDPWIQSFWASF